jgi:hypothetical protein
MARPIKRLTLSVIASLPVRSLDGVSLRELVEIVQAEGVEPVNPDERLRHHQAAKRYSLPQVEKAVRRYKKAADET